jgi:hypothetical protein
MISYNFYNAGSGEGRGAGSGEGWGGGSGEGWGRLERVATICGQTESLSRAESGSVLGGIPKLASPQRDPCPLISFPRAAARGNF